MLDWLPKKRPGISPRQLLGEVVADVADAALAARAIKLYESPEELEQFFDQTRTDAPWVLDGRDPDPAELAATIFFDLLIVEARIGTVDWADGPDSVLSICEALLIKAGANPLSTEERKTLLSRAEGSKRGEALLKMRRELERVASHRDLVFVCLSRGEDAHFPMVLKSATYEKWRNKQFGKGFPVLP